MEVILLERIERLGQMGDVVNVKSGYARNFLLPQKKALRASEENRKHFDGQRAHLEAENLKHRSEAEGVAKKIDGFEAIVIRQAGESDQLYGSVSARDLVLALDEAGFKVARSQVNLVHNIKSLGIYDCRVALHPEVVVTIKVNVARTTDEAKTQTKEAEAAVKAAAKADSDAAFQDEAEAAAKKAEKKGAAGLEDAADVAPDEKALEAALDEVPASEEAEDSTENTDAS